MLAIYQIMTLQHIFMSHRFRNINRWLVMSCNGRAHKTLLGRPPDFFNVSRVQFHSPSQKWLKNHENKKHEGKLVFEPGIYFCGDKLYLSNIIGGSRTCYVDVLVQTRYSEILLQWSPGRTFVDVTVLLCRISKLL